MRKARRKFVAFAMAAVFVLLTVLLTLINVVNFNMVAEDADKITERILGNPGAFAPDKSASVSLPQRQDSPFGRMGIDSPELSSSIRYFLFRYVEKTGEWELVRMRISAFTEEEALELARTLKDSQSAETGWLRSTYRYRITRSREETCVTVIDQGRELLPAYRTLLISVIGEVIGLAVSFLFLWLIGRRLFKPLEEADRKQKRFIADAGRELKLPLTVLGANAEVLERKYGTDEATDSIHRQIRKLSALVNRIGSMAIFSDDRQTGQTCDLSGILTDALEQSAAVFSDRSIALTASIDPGITVTGDPSALERAVVEIVRNVGAFALTRADVALKREGERVLLTVSNDAALTVEGNVDQVFDRFTVLENAGENAGSGLGLPFVRDVIRGMDGRVRASVERGTFTLQVIL